MNIYILGIESSCDDTAAAVTDNSKILANVIAGQDVHKDYGGVVPELASRAHQQNIIPVVQRALQTANISKNQINAVAYTRGPGLLGSLLVGSSFAKAFALALKIPLIEADHIHAHIFSLFIQEKDSSNPVPDFPFLCLTVSGGHTQISVVRDYFDIEVIGRTIDDAAGESFDKAAKIMGLPYPGGPLIDKYAKEGNPVAFKFSKPRIEGLDFSFSGLKTSFLYFIRDSLKQNPRFIEENKNDLCASIQKCIVDMLMEKLHSASVKTGIKNIAVAGGVSANMLLRNNLLEAQEKYKWKTFAPKPEYCTDNAAMIAVTGY